MVARRAHNPKVAGSSPALATKTIKRLYYYIVNRFFISEVIIWSHILVAATVNPNIAKESVSQVAPS